MGRTRPGLGPEPGTATANGWRDKNTRTASNTAGDFKIEGLSFLGVCGPCLSHLQTLLALVPKRIATFRQLFNTCHRLLQASRKSPENMAPRRNNKKMRMCQNMFG